MSSETSQEFLTAAEFLELELPKDGDNDYELIAGRLALKSRLGIGGKPGRVIFKLSQMLADFLQTRPNGWVFTMTPTNLGQPQGRHYVEPDVSFVSVETYPWEITGYLPVAPDFVAEVWSPTDAAEKIQSKIQAYLFAGVRLVWSIYLAEKQVEVFWQNEPDSELFDINGVLDGEDVITGFKLPVGELFD